MALKACLKLEKRGIKVTNLIVSNEIKRSYRQTVRVMKVLEKRRLIQLVKPSVNVRGRKCPAIYSVCS